MSMPRAIEGETPEIHPDGLHFCDKPVLPGALRRLCDAVLGRVVASSGSSGWSPAPSTACVFCWWRTTPRGATWPSP
jgi:hypothetical protein